MAVWNRWLRRPQSVWLRKALFQVHLWTGIGLGLYIVVMSVTGIVLLYRREITAKFGTPPRVTVTGPRMSPDDFKAAAERAHPGYEVVRVIQPTRRNSAIRPVEVWLQRSNVNNTAANVATNTAANATTTANAASTKMLQRYFDPYTGADLAPVMTTEYRVFQFMADLHDRLLLGMTGLLINGVGGILTTLMCMTGLVIWWPGIDKWRRSLWVEWRANPKRMNWTLHSAVGFWCFAFVFLWGFSSIYLAFPTPFQWVADRLTPADQSSKYFFAGDAALQWLAQLHFGRFGGLGVELVWTAFGLAPIALFVTGAIMWWNRALRPWLRRTNRSRFTVHSPRPEKAAADPAI